MSSYACVTTEFAEGQFRCDPLGSGLCPQGLSCHSDGRCRSQASPPPPVPTGSCVASLLGPELVPIRAGDARWSCIDRSEVTRAQYKKWWEATPWDPFGAIAGCSGEAPTPTAEWNTKAFDNPERPVTFVSWCFAARFCKAAGKRLCGKIGGGAIEAAARNDPAHSEWFASCSSAGTYKYPYGDAFNPSGCNGVGAGNGHSVAVFSLAQCKTPEGVFDLSGNVWEWVDSCEPNGSCLNRGGGFNAADPQSLACAASTVEGVATPKATTAVTIGFRCCAEYVY